MNVTDQPRDLRHADCQKISQVLARVGEVECPDHYALGERATPIH